ncbi:MAG: T9SS type A sorting domain-containing protein [Flavobacteriales bacterium]|nr:T9SS type A sorting domain-containing protein [Flavobacteriales bacterium]
MKSICTTLLVVCTAFFARSQDFIPGAEYNKNMPNVGRHQQAFEEWKQGKDLSKEKGWKWYRRWLYEQEVRANPDGSFADEGLALEEASKAAAWKSALQASRKNLAKPNWMPVGPDQFPGTGMGRINCVTFHPTDPNTLWIGVAQGGVWKTTNNGQSWTPLTDDLPILRISDIALDPNDVNTMYISVGDYGYLGVALNTDNRKRHTHYGIGVYKTTDGGSSWQPTGLTFNVQELDGSLTRRVFVDPDSSQKVLAAGTYGVMMSRDGGATWTQKLDQLIWDIESDPNNPHILFAASGFVGKLNKGSAGVYRSTDFGETWTLLNTGIPATNAVERTEVAVAPSNSNYVYASCCDGDGAFYACYRSTDGGNTWQQRSTSPNLFTWGSSGSGGQGWYDELLMVDPDDENKVFTGAIYCWGSDDGGSTWDGVGASFHVDLHMLKHNPVSGRTYLCADGGISWTDDLKIGTWSPQNFPTVWNNISSGFIITSFYRLGLSENNPGYIIGGAQDNSTFYYDNNQWDNIFGGDGMEAIIHPDNPGTIYGSSQGGAIRRSYNGGQTSSSIVGSISESGEWTTPYIMDANNPNTLYAAFGNVWKSTNAGTNWSKISSFPSAPGFSGPSPASALGVCEQDPAYMYVSNRIYHSSGAPTKVRMTSNGGSSWTDVSAGLPDSLYCTYITVDDTVGQNAWAVFGGYVNGVKVFRTTDGGSSWTNISLNLPNLPVNCIEEDRESLHNDIYIGMDVGVYHLNDTMTSWEMVSDGLPNVIISELEIHYGERKMYAATFGRGFWKTDLPLGDPTSSEHPNAFEDVVARIWPSPNQGNFQLEIRTDKQQNFEMEILDISGRSVYQREVNMAGPVHRENIQAPLSPGLYFLKLTTGKNSRAVKFVVE